MSKHKSEDYKITAIKYFPTFVKGTLVICDGFDVFASALVLLFFKLVAL